STDWKVGSLSRRFCLTLVTTVCKALRPGSEVTNFAATSAFLLRSLSVVEQLANAHLDACGEEGRIGKGKPDRGRTTGGPVRPRTRSRRCLCDLRFRST